MAKNNPIPKRIQGKKITRKKSNTIFSFSKQKGGSRLKIGIFLAMAILLVILLVYYQSNHGLKKGEFTSLTEDIPEGFKSVGIDVSHHQGEIDWDSFLNIYKYDTLVDFIYVKATEGTTHVDTQWENNREALLTCKPKHGAYHFFSPGSNPKLQAKHFLNHYTYKIGDLPPVLDVESEGTTDKQLLRDIEIWCTTVEASIHVKPIIYTSLHFFETKFNTAFLEYDFWIAAYNQRPETALEDDRVIHWQFSESGALPLSKNAVDLNVSFLKW